MTYPSSLRAFLGTAAVFALPWVVAGQAPASGTSQAKRTETAAAPRTAGPRLPDGHPDFSGSWSYATATPLERPKAFAGKASLTDEEAAVFVKGLASGGCRILKCDGSAASKVATAYDDFWWDFGDKLTLNRTSLIVDPPDGLMPALTAAAQEQAKAAFARRASAESPAGPEDLSLSDRCMMGFNSGPPLTPSAYNNNIHVFQTHDHIALMSEMIHNTRVVALDGRPHLSAGFRQWAGDSRGRWEGDALVIETTNFRPETAPGGGNHLTARLVERLFRVSGDILMYEYRMDDPAIWTRPWTVQIPMTRNTQPMYEYACHEGNYALANILKGARADEQAARGKQAPR